jgi:hypothetical protein
VHVHVHHILAAIAIAINQGAIAAFGYAQIFGDLFRRQKKLTHEGSIIGYQIVEGKDMALGDDHNMHRRLRLNIPKRQHFGIIVNDVGWNFSRHDLAKNAVGHARSPHKFS